MNKHKTKCGANQGYREFSLKPSAPLTKAPRIKFQLFRTAHYPAWGLTWLLASLFSPHQALTILLVTDPLFLRDREWQRQVKCNYSCLFCILHQTQHICDLETHLYYLKQQPDLFLPYLLFYSCRMYYKKDMACIIL